MDFIGKWLYRATWKLTELKDKTLVIGTVLLFLFAIVLYMYGFVDPRVSFIEEHQVVTVLRRVSLFASFCCAVLSGFFLGELSHR